jgi:uncharacterized SAM-binding protein YcdF (DUF218 family)
MNSTVRRLARLALVVIGLWLAGFGWFAISSLLVRGDPISAADAAVVLTGGKWRLETGLALLAEGRAEKLFISGVNQRVDRAALLRTLGPTAEREGDAIVIGHEAEDTFGNALETASWMHEQGYQSLLLVTSWYHMQRSLLEFRRAMPQIEISPQPVFVPSAVAGHWWERRGAAVLVIEEYHKFLAAWLRPWLGPLQSLLPRPSGEPQATSRNAVAAQ